MKKIIKYSILLLLIITTKISSNENESLHRWIELNNQMEKLYDDVFMIDDKLHILDIDSNNKLYLKPGDNDRNYNLCGENEDENFELIHKDNTCKKILTIEKEENDKFIIKNYVNDTDFTIIKELNGKKFMLINPENIAAVLQGFLITNDVGKQEGSTGHYMAVIDKFRGEIIEINKEFSLSAHPVIHWNRLYFVDLDQNISIVDIHDHEIIQTFWKNNTGKQITNIVIDSCSITIQLRKEGQNEYKSFHVLNSVLCNHKIENDISNFYYLNPPEKIRECGTFSYFVREKPGELPKVFIQREFRADQEDCSAFTITTAKQYDRHENYDYDGNDIESLKALYNEIKDLEEDEFKTYFQSKSCEKAQKKKLEELLIKDFERDFPDLDIVKPYTIYITNPNDGFIIPVNVYPPYRKKGDNLPKPLIMDIHGGPTSHKDIVPMDVERQYMASQGLWVIGPEPRGSSGYGEEHEAASRNSWGKGHISDIIAVAEHFKNMVEVDGENFLLMGDSFGGYTAMAMATFSPYRDYFKAYVAIAGVSNVGKAFKESPKQKKKGLDAWRYRIGFNADEDYENNEQNKEISPYYHVEKLSRPIMLIHGRHDTTVLPEESINFYNKTKESNKTILAIIIEDMDHSFKGKEGFLAAAELPLRFFRSVMNDNYKNTSASYHIDNVEDFLNKWED